LEEYEGFIPLNMAKRQETLGFLLFLRTFLLSFMFFGTYYRFLRDPKSLDLGGLS
jgi:hypothetical protein